jgi:hypothetical protein
MDISSTYLIHMKPVQIMMDPTLLEELDATAEVQAEGRSAVLRRAVSEYLGRRRATEIRERYRQAYGDDDALASDLEGWTVEGAWPAV